MAGLGCSRETPAGGTRPGPRWRGRAIYSSRRGDIRDGRVRAPLPWPPGRERAGLGPTALPGPGRLSAGMGWR